MNRVDEFLSFLTLQCSNVSGEGAGHLTFELRVRQFAERQPHGMGHLFGSLLLQASQKRLPIASQGLTPVPASKVSAPTIDEAVIAYECRTVHRNDLAPETIAPDIVASLYPEGDFHRCYYGHILAVQATDNVSEVLA